MIVERECQIDARRVHHAVSDHRLHAADPFLGGLEHQLHRAGKLWRNLLEHRGNAKQRGGVDVVAAGVHQAGLRAGERQPGLLLDRQRVHVGADGQYRTGSAAFDQADDPGASNACLVADAETGQFARDDAGSAHLLAAQFGMGMDVAADFDQCRLDAPCGVADRDGRVIG